MKCLLIDVKNNKVEFLDIEPKLQNYYDLIGCDYIDIVSRKLGCKYFDFICDDNGLYSNNNFVSAIDCGGLVMLVGNLIICNHDAEGNEVSLTQEEIEYIVKNHIKYRVENENEYKPIITDIITDMEGWFTK